ncbi:MAG: phosphate acyltransferase [Candidatus Omnitrophota bacterium]
MIIRELLKRRVEQINAQRTKRPLIVLPEAGDERVVRAARQLKEEGLVDPLLLGRDSLSQDKIEQYAAVFYDIRKARGITPDDARRIVSSPVYYAAMLVRAGGADGFVAGAAHTTPDVARAAIYCLGRDKRHNVVSGCFIICVPECEYGEGGLFIFADCAIIPEPNARQLSCIALSAADLAKKVLGVEPRVAMLSFSTVGSSGHPSLARIREAVDMAREASPSLSIDGELQLDSAIIPEVAKIKKGDNVLGGRANVLVFPDLNSGNIGYKLAQRLARARAVGPVLQGLSHPCCDLSRGCSADDIMDCAYVCATD